MSEAGYQPHGEPRWWQEAHHHLVKARAAAANALAHNLDDPTKILEVLDKLEEADQLAREVMREKGIPCG